MTSLGRLLGVFNGFALQSYLTKGVSPIRYGGVDSLFETTIYMGGLYAALYAKELAKNNEPEQDDMIFRTMMMMPLAAPIGALQMASEPIALQLPQQMMRHIGNIADAAYPKDEDGY